MTETFALLLAFQLKHFVADFPLQTRGMLGKFRPGWGFVPPLLAHVSVHGAMTLAICLAWTRELPLSCALAATDMSVHFAMDRLKASPHWLGRWRPLSVQQWGGASDTRKRENDRFWWSLGLDQMVHHLTHYYVIWQLLGG